MSNHTQLLVTTLAVAHVLALAGCGGDSDGNSRANDANNVNNGGATSSTTASGGAAPNNASDGQITDAWRGYCVATFTEDYDVVDSFGDVLFRAHTGEEYLIADLDSARPELVYLTPDGPNTFEFKLDSDTPSLPFSSNCTSSETQEYYAAFTAVSVYDTEQLATKICDLAAGSVLPATSGANAGYVSVGMGMFGPAVYELELNAFSAQCGGAARGYISVPETEVFGATTWLVPVILIVGPKSV